MASVSRRQALVHKIQQTLSDLSVKVETLQDEDIEQLCTIDNMLTNAMNLSSTPPDSHHNQLPRSPDTPTLDSPALPSSPMDRDGPRMDVQPLTVSRNFRTPPSPAGKDSTMTTWYPATSAVAGGALPDSDSLSSPVRVKALRFNDAAFLPHSQLKLHNTLQIYHQIGGQGSPRASTSARSSTYTSVRSPESPVSRRSVQYHGLYNQGSTCYLNSVLQVLYRTEDFREALEKHCHENDVSENSLDRHLQSLFKDLERTTANTCNITKCLGINRVYEQQDAAEYFEKILRLTSSDVSQIFHGESTHKTICSSCSTETDSPSSFWNLPLVLGDSDNEFYSVVEGIEYYFRYKHLTGENQRYCNSCDAKSDATIKRIVKNHPKVLMLLLKRFTLDYTYMQYIKINSTVIVPYTLHIPENQTYELYAVVDHFGSLSGGHYSATINVDGGWYKFNDTRVKETQQVNTGESFLSDSAYLLFYKKTKVHAADNGTPNIHEVSTTENFQTPAIDNYETDEHEENEIKIVRPEMHSGVKDKHSYNGQRKISKDKEGVVSKAHYQAGDKEILAQGTDCGGRDKHIQREHNKCPQSKNGLERQHHYGEHMSKNDGGLDDAKEKKSGQMISATQQKQGKTKLSEAKFSKRTETAGSTGRTESKGKGREQTKEKRRKENTGFCTNG